MAERFTPQHFKPRSEAQARDVIRWAADADTPLEVRSAGSKRALGRPGDAGARLDLSGLAGIVDYEPEELVITLGPGTPMADLNAALAQHNQMLAFEPPDLGGLWGQAPGGGTIGGIVGTNLAGPRRVKAGAARDFVLGVRGVSGFGELFKSGGRVVKNVTGYDLSKLMTGSYGTLAALTELTLKVLPRPETATTLVLFGLDLRAACRAMGTAASGPWEPSGLAWLPADAAASSTVPAVADGGAAATAIRLEGPAVSLDHRLTTLRQALPAAASARLAEDESAALWREVRDVAPLLPSGKDTPVWRLTVPPATAPAVLDANPARAWLCDWAGGLIWLVPDDANAAPTLAAGSFALVRAGAAARTHLPAFSPLDPPLARLTRKVKAQFDPKGVLNPGRLYENV